MAQRLSPGIFSDVFTFQDYTPQDGGTIPCIVGGATKGPLNTPTLVTSSTDLVRQFGDPVADDYGLLAAVDFLENGGSQMLYTRVADSAAASASHSIASSLKIEAANPGTWGNTIKVTVTQPSAVAGATNDTFDLKVEYPVEKGSSVYQTVETYSNMKVLAAADRYAITLVNDGKPGVTNKSKYIKLTDLGDSNPTAGTYTLTGGVDGIFNLQASDYVGSISGTTATGLKATQNTELHEFNLLLVPGVSNSTVVSEMIATAEARGDCLALIDPPLGLSPTEVNDWANGTYSGGGNPPTSILNSSYAAVYWSWVTRYQSHLNANITTPPSGLVAGAMAAAERKVGPWRAVAGYVHGKIAGDQVEYSPLQSDRDLLQGNGNSVNPIVQFADGLYIFGNRTLERSSTPMDAVHVTRLVTYLRSTVSKAVRPLLFAPNDQDTWREFVAIVRPIMESVKSQRGVQAYVVQCDAETNPPETRGQKILNGRISLQHIDAAEIIQLDFALTPTSTDLTVS
jgi:phage tail sheath protein FI